MSFDSATKALSLDALKFVKDEYVIQTMRYLELVKEVKKSGNKKQKVI